jgi:hypothetical protein
MIHSLNPGLDPKVAKELFYQGMKDALPKNSQQYISNQLFSLQNLAK